MRVKVDLRSLQKKFSQAPQVLHTEIVRALMEAAVIVQREARQVHRFNDGSGRLAGAITVDMSQAESNYETSVFLDKGTAPYGGYVHDGTKPHEIRPKNKAALAFVGKGGKMVVVPKKWGWYWSKLVKETGIIGSKKGYVNHPGTAPDQFIYRAAFNLSNQIVAMIRDSVKFALRNVGLMRR